jgi:hypothetical protein
LPASRHVPQRHSSRCPRGPRFGWGLRSSIATRAFPSWAFPAGPVGMLVHFPMTPFTSTVWGDPRWLRRDALGVAYANMPALPSRRRSESSPTGQGRDDVESPRLVGEPSLTTRSASEGVRPGVVAAPDSHPLVTRDASFEREAPGVRSGFIAALVFHPLIAPSDDDPPHSDRRTHCPLGQLQGEICA